MASNKEQKISEIWATVYDCGGRGGVHRSWRGFPLPVHYVSFEPEEDAFVKINAEAHSAPGRNWKHSVEPIALSDKEGIKLLNVYKSADLSSFLEIDPDLTYRYREQDVHRVDQRKVACDTLDHVSARRREEPDFLCVDTQGAELQVLKGAGQILGRSVIGVRCEVEFISLYRNQPLFDQIWRFLSGRGFRLVRFEKPGTGACGISTDAGPFSLSVEDAVPAWADAIFVRSPDLSPSEYKGTSDQMVKYVLFTLSNGCGSAGLDLLRKLSLSHDLEPLMNALSPSDRELLASAALQYLDRVARSDWQRKHSSSRRFGQDRARLRRTLSHFSSGRERNREKEEGISQAVFYERDILRIDAQKIEGLRQLARESSNGRARLCLHRDHSDPVQEMVIALCKGSSIPPHRQTGKRKSYKIVEGELAVLHFDALGQMTHRVKMGFGEGEETLVYRFSADSWHTVIALSEMAVYIETIPGPFREGGTEFLTRGPGANGIETTGSALEKDEDVEAYPAIQKEKS